MKRKRKRKKGGGGRGERERELGCTGKRPIGCKREALSIAHGIRSVA